MVAQQGYLRREVLRRGPWSVGMVPMVTQTRVPAWAPPRDPGLRRQAGGTNSSSAARCIEPCHAPLAGPIIGWRRTVQAA